MKTKDIIPIIIIFVMVGLYIEISEGNIKLPELKKDVPCTVQTSPDGRMTITQGDCKGKLPEDKIIGTWTIDTQTMKGSITFNSDHTGTYRSQMYGNIFFTWNVQNGVIYSKELSRYFGGEGIPYSIVNNDRTLVLAGTINLDKSWW